MRLTHDRIGHANRRTNVLGQQAWTITERVLNVMDKGAHLATQAVRVLGRRLDSLGAAKSAGRDSGDGNITDEPRVRIAGKLWESRTSICSAAGCTARTPSAMVHGSHRSNATTHAPASLRAAGNPIEVDGGDE